MTCKSSKSLPIETFNFLWPKALALSLWFLGTVDLAQAQQPSVNKEPKGYIRFWNMLPVIPTNNLLVLSGEKSMFGVSPGDVYTDYFASPVGSYNLAIKRVGEKQEPVAKVPVALKDGTYVTLLATAKGGQVNVQLIDDTPDPKVTDVAAQLIVRSFFTGGNVTVGVTGGQPAQPVPGGGTVTLDNLPMAATVNVVVQVTMPMASPTSRRWDLPADFSVTHHATLLLVPDQYGRLKPQLAYNGRVADPDAQQARERDGR